jgi:hypothetical protein
VLDLIDKYQDRILIQVIDPQSGLGFYKCLRYWIRSYPTFIVDGQEKVTGWDREKINAILQKRMTTSS